MLLRSISKHVKDQNWFAVALDFFIVVAGILIAFQITSWNEGRVETQRGAAYVERLISDISTDLRARGGLQKYFEAVNASAERTVILLASPSPDPKELVVNAYRATEFASYWPTAATWNEIVSSGDIGLLPASFVEDSLAAFIFTDTSAQEAAQLISSSPYRKRVRRIIPHEIQLSIRNGCGDVRGELQIIIGFQAGCKLDVSDEDLAKAAQALLDDPEVLPDLRLHFSILSSARGNTQGTMNALKEALRILEEAK